MHATSRTNPTAIMSAIRIEIRSEMPRKRSDDRPGRPVRGRVIAGQASSNGLQFRPRLRRCAPVSEPADHLKETRVSRLVGESGQARERLPHIADHREPEPIRHDADHCGGHAVDSDTASDDGRVCVVPRYPNAAAQHDHRRGARPIVVGDEIAAERRLLAEQLKCIRRDVGRRHTFGGVPVVAESDRRLAERCQAGECPGGRLKVPEVEIGRAKSAPAPGAVTRVDRHDPFGSVDRQAANHRVHDREHRAVHADPERQCKDCRQREPMVLQQQAGGKSKVLPDVVHPPRSTRIAATLLQLIISAEIEPCAATGLRLGHTHPDVVIHLTIEVIPKLGVELTLEPAAIAKALPPIHCAPPSWCLKDQRDRL